MNCPKCNEPLQKKNIETVEIDECAKCKGIWFDEDELRQAKDETDPDINWMDFDIWQHKDKFRVAAKPAKCPKCDVNMAAVDYDNTGVEIDVCRVCKGVWLDAGEFEKIIEKLIEEAAAKGMGDYFKNTLKEAKDLVTGPETFVSEWRDLMSVIRLFKYRIITDNPRFHTALQNLPKV